MKRILTALSVMMALILSVTMPTYALTNTPVSYGIMVESVRKGDVPSAPEAITYYLEAIDGAPLPASAVDGVVSLQISAKKTTSAAFDAIEYNAPGVYQYKLWQQEGTNRYAEYDDTVCRVEVAIYTDDNAVLSVEGSHAYVTVDGVEYKDDFSFTTKYDYPDPPVVILPTATPSPAPTATPTRRPLIPGKVEPVDPTPALSPAPTPDDVAAAATPIPSDDSSVELEENVPLASANGASWALLNLLFCILTVGISLVLLIGYFIKRKAKEEEDEAAHGASSTEAQPSTKRKNKGFARVFSVLPAVVSVVFFILTEDMTLPMVLMDRWTIVMLLIALVQMLVAVSARKKDVEQEDGEAA